MAFAVAQHLISAANTSDASGNTAAQIWTSTPTPGNLMCVALTFRGNATVTGPVGWTQAATRQNGTTCQTEVWYKVADSGDTTTGPVFVIAVSVLYVIAQAEISGWTGTPTLDVTGTAAGTAVSTLTVTASSTTTAATEFAFGAFGDRQGGTAGLTWGTPSAAGGATIGSPNPVDSLNPAKNNEGLADAWSTTGGSGTSPSFTETLSVATNTTLAYAMATFKDVAAAPVQPQIAAAAFSEGA